MLGCTILSELPHNGSENGLYLVNQQNIREVFLRLADRFSQLMRHRAYLHTTMEMYGVEQMEWLDHEVNLQDLCSEYVMSMGRDYEDWDEGEDTDSDI